MEADISNVVVIAGSNGSGKSTAAPALLRDYVGLKEFVNADVIAQGLSGFDAANAAVAASTTPTDNSHLRLIAMILSLLIQYVYSPRFRRRRPLFPPIPPPMPLSMG